MATIALLAPGRVFLGVGSGESMNETPLTTTEWPEPGERLRRMREAVKLIKHLWSDDYVTFEGKYFRTKEAKLFDKPPQPIPLLIPPPCRPPAAMSRRIGGGAVWHSSAPRRPKSRPSHVTQAPMQRPRLTVNSA